MAHTTDCSMSFLVFQSSFSLHRYWEARDSGEGLDLLRITVDPLGIIGGKIQEFDGDFSYLREQEVLVRDAASQNLV